MLASCCVSSQTFLLIQFHELRLRFELALNLLFLVLFLRCLSTSVTMIFLMAI